MSSRNLVDRKTIVIFSFMILLPFLLLIMNEKQTFPRSNRIMFGESNVKNFDPVESWAPILHDPVLNTQIGYPNRTIFNFSITYTEPGGEAPLNLTLVLIHENWTGNFSMVNTSLDYANGVIFYFNLTLPYEGNYSHYYLACSTNSSSLKYPSAGYLNGPSIIKLENYSIAQVQFQWMDTSAGEEWQSGNYMDVYDLKFAFKFYNEWYNQIQVSHHGFARFYLRPFYEVYEIPIPSSELNSRYSIVLVSNDTFGQIGNYTGSQTRNFYANYQYVLFKNGSILFNLKDMIFSFPANASLGINYGNGIHFSAFNYSTSLHNVSLMFSHPNENKTRVYFYNVTPSTGNQVSVFNFSLNYQNIGNVAPTSVQVIIDGTYYSIDVLNPSDTNFIDGVIYHYSAQFLDPGIEHNYSYYVLTPDGWYNSSVSVGPNVTYSNNNEPVIEGFISGPDSGYMNWTNYSIHFTYKDLDNDAPQNLSIIFNSSSQIYTFSPAKVDQLDDFYYDGVGYYLELNYLNCSFLYEGFEFYIHIDDGQHVIRWPSNASEWIEGLTYSVPLSNYSVSKLLHFEWYDTDIENSTLIFGSTVQYEYLVADLPFNFSFYGLNYSQVVVSRYGNIRFSGNYYSNLPEPGDTNIYSWLSISLLNIEFWFSPISWVRFQNFEDAFVVQYFDVGWEGFSHTGEYLGDFEIILHDNGDITLSFLYLTHYSSGGINVGDGTHFTKLPVDAADLPLNNVSFIFTSRDNYYSEWPFIEVTTNGTVFTTSDDVELVANFTSSVGIPLKDAYCVINNSGFLNDVRPTINQTLAVHGTSNTKFSELYSTSVKLAFVRNFSSGLYMLTCYFTDIFGNQFTSTSIEIIVNDPPSVILIEPFPIPTSGGVGDNLTFTLNYSDPEGLAPEYVKLVWDDIEYNL
ncbi:MAG: hypothetical protein ACTSRA_14450, partial [Promethearchaeota archaeon]